jgi:hypothetical protein
VTVNAGELALATVGVSALIENDLPRMGIGKIEEALSIPRKAMTLARKLCAGELKYTPMPRPHSYPKMLARFTKALAAPDVQSWIDMFPPEAAAMSGAFQLVAQEAMEHMKGMFPTASVTTFVGPRNMMPDDVRVWRFFSQLELLNDPLRAFELMATGALLRSQVLAVREIYPTMTAMFDASLYEQIGRAKAAKLSYQLPPRAEQGVAVWLDRRFVDHAPPKAPELPAGPPPQTGAPNKVAAGLATRTQEAINNS